MPFSKRSLGKLIGANPVRGGSFTDVVGTIPATVDVTTAYTETTNLYDAGGQLRSFLFNGDGTKVYLLYYDTGTYNSQIREMTLSTAYDLTTAGSSTNINWSYTYNSSQNWFWSHDGTRVYAMKQATNQYLDFFYHDCSTAYDLTTAGTEQSDGMAAPTGYGGNFASWGAPIFNADGTKCFWFNSNGSAGHDEYMYEWNLSTAYDLTTSTYVTKYDLSSVLDNALFVYAADSTGTKFIGLPQGNTNIKTFTTSSPYDFSSVTAERTNDSKTYNISTGGQYVPEIGTFFYSTHEVYHAGTEYWVSKIEYDLTPGSVTTADRTTSNVGILSLDEAGPKTNEGTAVAGDEYWDDVTLLLDGSSTTDLSSASPTVTPSASGLTSGNSGGKYGQYIDFQDSGYINVALPSAIGAVSGGAAEAFTVECWAYFDSSSADGLFQILPSGNILDGSADTNAYTLAVAIGGGKWIVYYDGGQTGNIGTTISTNTWYHVALVFDGTDLVFYVDGSALQTYSNHAANLQTNGYENIAIGGYYSTSYVMDGRIEDFRITKGVARYTGTFTPPTEALPQGAPVAAKQLTQMFWGGIRGRDALTSVASSVSLANTGILSLSEMLQASYGAVTWDGTGLNFLAVAGGGAGSSGNGGGSFRGGGGAGGAGGYVTSWAGSSATETSGGGAAVSSSLTISSGSTYVFTVGKGGTRGDSSGTLLGTNGSDTTMVAGATTLFSATGGGRGGEGYNNSTGGTETGAPGGSGGGGGADAANVQNLGGTGSQGSDGGFGQYSYGNYLSSGGGGGAGADGGDVNVTGSGYGGEGGDGLQSTITGTPTYRAGGGGGSSADNGTYLPGDGGQGGGGNGTGSNNSTYLNRSPNAQPHVGGGGGGSSFRTGAQQALGGHGGSGVIILRLPAASGYDQTKFAGELTSNSNVTASYGTDNGDLIVTLQITDATSSDPRGTSNGTVTWTPSF